MKTTNETCTESNYSSFIKEPNQKNALGYFPLLKFKENLYSTCQSKFSEFINTKKDELKLIINNKINQQISINDYIHNSPNVKLTPIPSINKRKIKNEGEKKELKKFQRNVVLMRRLEYANKMKEKSMKKKYKNENKQIIFLQKMIRGYLVRKVIKQVNIINETLLNFVFLIAFCIKKKFFPTFKNNINQLMALKNNEKNNKIKLYDNDNDNEENNNMENDGHNGDMNMNIDNEVNNSNIELNDNNDNENILNENMNELNKENNKDEKTEKSETNFINYETTQNANHYNIDNNNHNIHSNSNIISKNKKSMEKITEQLNDIKNNNNNDLLNEQNKSKNNTLNTNNMMKYNSPYNIDSVIENDDYIDFSGKYSKKNSKNANIIKQKNSKKPLNYVLSDASPRSLKKTKTETIQRQFRKYLSKKGYYGKFDKRKIAIIYLLKNMMLYNIKIYVFNILNSLYKDIINITLTQEENYFNISTERIQNNNQIYDIAYSHINS